MRKTHYSLECRAQLTNDYVLKMGGHGTPFTESSDIEKTLRSSSMGLTSGGMKRTLGNTGSHGAKGWRISGSLRLWRSVSPTAFEPDMGMEEVGKTPSPLIGEGWAGGDTHYLNPIFLLEEEAAR